MGQQGIGREDEKVPCSLNEVDKAVPHRDNLRPCHSPLNSCSCDKTASARAVRCPWSPSCPVLGQGQLGTGLEESPIPGFRLRMGQPLLEQFLQDVHHLSFPHCRSPNLSWSPQHAPSLLIFLSLELLGLGMSYARCWIPWNIPSIAAI